jgi:hypothetical protein
LPSNLGADDLDGSGIETIAAAIGSTGVSGSGSGVFELVDSEEDDDGVERGSTEDESEEDDDDDCEFSEDEFDGDGSDSGGGVSNIGRIGFGMCLWDRVFRAGMSICNGA